ncbi:hypothetical protein [Delftia acidovorans]|uniref:hypothetical protein n=1 Tax=Delftia acidovorans TaxID=80866 RepID=UPI0022AB95EB|nr:hypothetical protein [Delftia acidovorans]WAT84508.1 hypothetical protein O1V13_24215 [Delftia acidovorans]
MSAGDKPLGSNGGPLLWLDYADYAAALLANGNPPWLHTADCVAWLRKAQGLLRSDVVALPLQTVALAWVAAHADLRQALGTRKKVGYPLKTLLGDGALRGHLVELADGLRASFGSQVLALACPVPGDWLALAYREAFGAEAEADIDDDAVDSAAIHVADFLRVFGQSGIDALLLDDSAGPMPATQATLDLYQPIFNVCGHYRWDAGVLAPRGVEGNEPADMTFAITCQPAHSGQLALIPGSFWTAGAASAVPMGKRLYARIPQDSTPEAVLQRLAILR